LKNTPPIPVTRFIETSDAHTRSTVDHAKRAAG